MSEDIGATEMKEEREGRPWLWIAAGVGLFIAARAVAAALNRYRLKGRIALITGGSRGLGLVLARKLAEKGVKLVICSRSPDQLERARLELETRGADVLAVPCDVTDKAQVDVLVKKTIERFGKIDILINNAGVIQVGPLDAMTTSEYEEAMKTHFWAPLYLTLACLPYFRIEQQGRIVNIASIGGKIAVPHLLPYTASKFALVGLSEGLHAELKRENILVFTITPGLMLTGSTPNITVKGDHKKEYAWFKTAASIPLLSQDPNIVAGKIVRAIECHDTHPTLSYATRFGSLSKELAPNWVEFMQAQVSRILPEPVPEGVIAKTGRDSESSLSVNRFTKNTDRAAEMNNEN